jgi:hypothetical protein
MTALMVILLGAAAAVLLVRYLIHLDQRRQHFYEEWLAAAQALQLDATGEERKRSMVGEVGSVPVRVDFERERRGSGKSQHSVDVTTFSAGGDGRIPKSLELRGDSAWRQLGRVFGGSDTTTGDRDFDQLTELPTMNAYVCAALSEPLREQLMAFVAEGASVSNGVITAKHENVEDPDRRWLGARIEHIARLAGQLGVTPETLAARLAHNAVHDAEPAVREQNLHFLLARETRAPAELVSETARALLPDRNPVVRLHAARQLGADGHPTLKALAADDAIDSALRARALGALHEGNAADIDDWIESFLLPGPPALVCAALGVVAARRLSAHTDRVIALTSAADASLRVAATRTLGSLESPPIERCLLQLLAGEETEVQIAAAQALGTVGSVSAVEPLLPLTKGFGRGPLRDAARGAIASIQSRLGDVQAGRLSLVEHDALAGAVALAAAEAPLGGEVTVAADPEVPAHTRRG